MKKVVGVVVFWIITLLSCHPLTAMGYTRISNDTIYSYEISTIKNDTTFSRLRQLDLTEEAKRIGLDTIFNKLTDVPDIVDMYVVDFIQNPDSTEIVIYTWGFDIIKETDKKGSKGIYVNHTDSSEMSFLIRNALPKFEGAISYGSAWYNTNKAIRRYFQMSDSDINVYMIKEYSKFFIYWDGMIIAHLQIFDDKLTIKKFLFNGEPFDIGLKRYYKNHSLK